MGYSFYQTKAPQSNLLREIEAFKKELNDKYLSLIMDMPDKCSQAESVRQRSQALHKKEMQRNRAQIHLLNALYVLVERMEQDKEGREVLTRMQGNIALDRAYIQSLPARILLEAPALRKKALGAAIFQDIAMAVGGIPAALGGVYLLVGLIIGAAALTTLGAILCVPLVISIALVAVLGKSSLANIFSPLENFMGEMGYTYSASQNDYTRHISYFFNSRKTHVNSNGLGETGLMDEPVVQKTVDASFQAGGDAGNDTAFNPNVERLAENDRLNLGDDILNVDEPTADYTVLTPSARA